MLFYYMVYIFLPSQIAGIFQCLHSFQRYLECGIRIMWKCHSELVIIDLLHHTEIPLVFLFLLPWAIIMGSSCQSVDIIFPAVPSGYLALEVALASLLFPLIFVKCMSVDEMSSASRCWSFYLFFNKWILFFIDVVKGRLCLGVFIFIVIRNFLSKEK